MSELTNIKERLEKVVIAAPVEQSSIYQAMRNDLRYLLGYVSHLEEQLAGFTPKDAA